MNRPSRRCWKSTCFAFSRPRLSIGLPFRKSALLAKHGMIIESRRERDRLMMKLNLQSQELTKIEQNTRPLVVLKDSIVNSVSHEMHTPLLQVKSAVALLAESARMI